MRRRSLTEARRYSCSLVIFTLQRSFDREVNQSAFLTADYGRRLVKRLLNC
ncbi:MAG: hypothetical protein FWE67_16085 [Planctomycetaceae bacterium]|nr:hypothetical protein [Planctomycetaceae bacterium]